MMMKKVLKLIIFLAMIAIFGETTYAAMYLEDVDFEATTISDSTHWTGKEWITNTYPPRRSISTDEFIQIEGTEDVKEILGFETYEYVWTGSDYLVYSTHHHYLDYGLPKHLYRISENFDKILNIYDVPNWINYLVINEDNIYIATESVWAIKNGEQILGVRRGDYELYCSKDCKEWIKLQNYDINSFHRIHIINEKLFIDNDIYNKHSFNPVVYENYSGSHTYKVGEYLCDVVSAETKGNESNTALSFSKDGVYWVYLPTDNKINGVKKVSDSGNSIVVETINGDYICNKELVFSQLNNTINSSPVYVKFNGKYLGFENPPVIEDGSTLVPMRFLFEQMGADVDWNGATRTATATLDDTAVTFSIDNTQATVNKAPAKMAVPARLIDDKTMVPLRFLSEELGFTVTWDADTRTAIIE